MKGGIKFAVIHQYRKEYPIQAMCAFFGVSRSGYYRYVRHMDKPEKDAGVAEMIRQCHQECGRTYGYRRVKIWLEREKRICLNEKTVLRVMRKYGLLSEIRRRKGYRRAADHLHRYPNLLDRDFHAERPNQKWVTDISYIQTGEGVLYLSMIRDLYDKSIVAYKTGTRQTVKLVTDTIRMAKRKEKVTAELQLHSDQGFQYTSSTYFGITQAYGILPSMSRRGNPYDNAMAENFFSILKCECIYRRKPQTRKQARKMIDDFIWFYNHTRLQTTTGMAPLEMRALAVS